MGTEEVHCPVCHGEIAEYQTLLCGNSGRTFSSGCVPAISVSNASSPYISCSQHDAKHAPPQFAQLPGNPQIDGRKAISASASLCAVRKVVVFGSTNTGKTSMINTLTGSDGPVSSGVLGTTKSVTVTAPFVHNGCAYQFFDTAGLDENCRGTAAAPAARASLKLLLKSLKEGLNLLIFVFKGETIKQSLVENYNLFYCEIVAKKVPILGVVTFCEQYDDLDKWVNDNLYILTDRYGLVFAEVVGCCFNAKPAPRWAELYNSQRAKSKARVLDAIARHALRDRQYPFHPGEEERFFEKVWRYLMDVCGGVLGASSFVELKF